jgi:hypothetical protein
MALHRGRIDLLEEHLRRDPTLLRRTFTFKEIFPPQLGCHDNWLPGMWLDGATLLHICVEFDELEIARWLLDRGMDPDTKAAVDADGLGGHTALFTTVVCFANFWLNFQGGWAYSRKPAEAPFTQLLLERGANPNARASMREDIRTEKEVAIRAHRNVTPLGWGDRFQHKMVVSAPAMTLIAEAGGTL